MITVLFCRMPDRAIEVSVKHGKRYYFGVLGDDEIEWKAAPNSAARKMYRLNLFFWRQAKTLVCYQEQWNDLAALFEEKGYDPNVFGDCWFSEITEMMAERSPGLERADWNKIRGVKGRMVLAKRCGQNWLYVPFVDVGVLKMRWKGDSCPSPSAAIPPPVVRLAA